MIRKAVGKKKKRVRPIRVRKKKLSKVEMLKRADRFVSNGLDDW